MQMHRDGSARAQGEGSGEIQIQWEPPVAITSTSTPSSTPSGTNAPPVIDPQPAVLDMLRAEVAPTEWREGGGDITGTRRIGALSGGVLVALATVEPPMGRLARIRVIVSPSYRRRGLGRLVLLALARKALNEGFDSDIIRTVRSAGYSLDQDAV